MEGDERDPDLELSKHDPDKHQQTLNRLYKLHEHVSFEDRQLRIKRDIEEMEIPDDDRSELLRRLL